MHRLIPAITLISFLTACSTAQHAADWNAWVDKTNASYTTDKSAVLKVQDAVYLKPGQTAYLSGVPEAPHNMSWLISPPARLSEVTVTFDSAEAGQEEITVKMLELERTFGSRLSDFEISDGVFFSGGLSGFGTDDPRYVLFLYNPEHSKAAEFEGLSFFPYNPDYRVEARIEARENYIPLLLQTERGLIKQFFDVGTAHFTLNGVEAELPLMSMAGENGELTSLFFTFMDDTTGEETYNVGRYTDVHIEGGELPETLTLDFNYAYNPLCSRSPHFNCPLVESVIPTAVRAGEKYAY